MLGGFEWWKYFCLAIGCAILAFGNVVGDGHSIFSKQNSRPFLEVLMIHAVFLTILLGLMRFADYIEPALPHWLTYRFSPDPDEWKLSILDWSFLLTFFAMSIIERLWLYMEADTNSNEPEE